MCCIKNPFPLQSGDVVTLCGIFNRNYSGDLDNTTLFQWQLWTFDCANYDFANGDLGTPTSRLDGDIGMATGGGFSPTYKAFGCFSKSFTVSNETISACSTNWLVGFGANEAVEAKANAFKISWSLHVKRPA